MLSRYPTYVFDTKCRVIPSPRTPVIDFDYLKSLLLSKDLTRLHELDWANDGQFRFLDGKVDMTRHSVAL